MSHKIPKDISLSVLNIGTAILVRDVMDQHLRSLGDIRTYYASNLHFALQTYSERHLDIIFCEFNFPNGSAEEFVRQIGGIDATDNLYFVISSGQNINHVKALASELNVDSVIEEPFSTNDIVQRVSEAIAKKERDRTVWINNLLEAKLAAKNKRQQEARSLFKELVLNNPNNESVLLEAAQFYLQIPELDAAQRTLSNVIALNPQSVKAKSLYASLTLKRGNYEEALRLLEEVQKFSPLNTSRANEIAYAYILMALKQSRTVLDINEASVLAISNSIKFQAVLGKYQEVLTTYNRYKDRIIGEEKKEIEMYVALCKKLGGLV